MEKMEFKSKDIVSDNVEKISNLFPNVVSEGKINFDKLRQELTNDLIEGDESYDFTWVGKKNSVIEANTPTTKTLRPCIEESENFDITENLYIEGDNLEVLKILQKSYFGKIKCIYIDPPYNTGNDFIYNDDFKTDSDEYKDKSGEVDDEGNRLFKNTDSNGRFHSDWCSMMYSRLKLAYNLLSDDGVIFISIDDSEVYNLKKICNEIFGEGNFVNCFMWLHGKGKKDTWSRTLQQYILAYAKNKTKLKTWIEEKFTNYEFSNPDNDPKGKWFSGSLSFSEERSNPHHENYYEIESPTGIKWLRQWQISKVEMEELIKNGDISWGDPIKCDGVPREKIRPGVIDVIPNNIIDEVGTTKSANEYLKKIFDNNQVFSNPKPVELICKLISIINMTDNIIILDYFSGSATTAESVLMQNFKTNKNNKYIMVQLPENLDDVLNKTSGKEAKEVTQNAIDLCDELNVNHTLCEIGKERIRRAGKKLLEDNKDKEGIKNLDIGFRVLKLSDSNMKDVYYNPDDYSQYLISQLTSNIKDDRNEDDLLFASLLDRGIDISKSYRKVDIDGKKVIIYNDEGEVPEFVACFDENITEKCITEIAKMKPLKATFRDSSFGSSSDRINVEEIFKLYSKDTKVSVM